MKKSSLKSGKVGDVVISNIRMLTEEKGFDLDGAVSISYSKAGLKRPKFFNATAMYQELNNSRRRDGLEAV